MASDMRHVTKVDAGQLNFTENSTPVLTCYSVGGGGRRLQTGAADRLLSFRASTSLRKKNEQDKPATVVRGLQPSLKAMQTVTNKATKPSEQMTHKMNTCLLWPLNLKIKVRCARALV